MNILVNHMFDTSVVYVPQLTVVQGIFIMLFGTGNWNSRKTETGTGTENGNGNL